MAKASPSALDVRLGLRMLAKYPALSLVGGLGLAVSVAVAVGFFAFMRSMMYPVLPLPDGQRIVAIENRDMELDNENRQAVHDFVIWRNELRQTQDVGAFRNITKNLIPSSGSPEAVTVAEMSANGFKVARVAPIMGRYLIDADERSDAPPVVVIGAKAWENRFAGDPNIVGRPVRFGGTMYTVVGVMPESFGFPQNHEFWMPFKADPSAYPRLKGPSIFIFGRLAPNATMETAQAELGVIGKRVAADFPQTMSKIQPMVMPYTHSLTDIQGMSMWMAVQMQLMMSILLVVVALNVAVLVYARTATRQGEIAVRSALGATRGRIVAQLFVEGLVLSLGAAIVGLGIAQGGLKLANGIMESEIGTPFWTDYSVKPLTLLFTLVVAVFAAVIIGVVPALQATGKRLTNNLRQLGGGTSGGLGKTWTALIVAQVAIAVAALPAAVSMGWHEIRDSTTRRAYNAEEYLITALRATPPGENSGAASDSRVDTTRFTSNVQEIMRRLSAEPGVLGVAYSGYRREFDGPLEVEGVPGPVKSPRGYNVGSDGAGPGSQELLGARLLTGRSFTEADGDTANAAVMVNRAFADQILAGGTAVGTRVRYAGTPARGEDRETPPSKWYTIVGVYENVETNRFDQALLRPRLYYAVALGATDQVELSIHTRGKAIDFAPRVREIVVAVDPSMRFSKSHSLDEFERQSTLATRLVALVISLVLVSVFLLSAAGIYALTSFTVTRRRREIGIRTALGALPGQVLRTIFSRVARQVATGLAVGVGAAALFDTLSGGSIMYGNAAWLLPTFAVLMAVVAVIAAIGPARQGLSIEPSEALRADG